MAQKIQDIQNNKRSVRNIQTNKNSNGEIKKKPPERSRTSSSAGFWFIAVIFALFLFFAFSVIFSGTKIIIEPKQATVNTEGEYTATQSTSSTADNLEYEVMTITQQDGKTVPAKGEEEVERKASGTITIYNNYSSDSFRLVPETRFESSSGKIYKTRQAVSIPGKTSSGPGKVEVVVDAAESGASYNIKDAEFTVPGLKGDPSFDTIYAETKTAIDGGASGVQKIVAKEDEEKARTELKDKLKQQLLKKAHSQKPEGFTLYDNAIFLSYENLSNQSKNQKVTVRQKATLHGVIFDNKELGAYLAQNYISSYKGGEVTVQNPEELTFTLVNKESFNPTEKDTLEFKLNGKANIVWLFDSTDIKKDFAGEDKSDIDRILSNYPGIEHAEVVIRPFWKQSFPSNPEEITIEKALKSENGGKTTE